MQTPLHNIEKAFHDRLETLKSISPNVTYSTEEDRNRLVIAGEIGKWTILDFEEARDLYQFSFEEIGVLTIHALSCHNQELFTYLYKKGYGQNTIETRFVSILKGIQKNYNSDIFKNTEALEIFLKAGGKLFKKLESTTPQSQIGSLKAMVFDCLPLQGDLDTLPALEDLDKNLLAHVYINECFDSNGDPIPENLKLFCRSLLPALFTTRKHYSAQIHPHELDRMLDKGPLPLGTTFAFLRSLTLRNGAGHEYVKNGQVEYSALQYNQAIISILCKNYDSLCATEFENSPFKAAHFIIEEYNQDKLQHEQFTSEDEHKFLEIMSTYYELLPPQSYSIHSKPLIDVLSDFKKNLGKYKNIDSMSSAALSNMLIPRILNHETDSEWEEHPISNTDNAYLLSNFKTKIACKCWTPEGMSLPEKNIHHHFYSLFLNKVVDEHAHWKRNYDRITLIKKQTPVIDEIFQDLIEGKSVAEKKQTHTIEYTLAHRQLHIVNHMKKMPIPILESVYCNIGQPLFLDFLFVQMIHKDLIKRKLSPKPSLSSQPTPISRF